MKSPRVQLAILPLVLSSCAHHAAPPAPAPASTESSAPDEGAPPSRALPRDATFADLVRVASYFDGQDESAATCLLSRDEGGIALTADVTAAVRPLPQPEIDLDSQLSTAHSVHVLTPYGAYGSARDALSLASFTLFPPSPAPLVLLLSDRGISVRAPFEQITTEAQPQAEALAALGDLQGKLVFVTAEGQIPVSEVYGVLASLAQQHAVVALAIALPATTRLPAPPTSPPADETLCPEGLPETAEPEGDLSREALLSSLAPLREHALGCLSRGGPGGAAGGALVAALRVDPQGTVRHACVVRSDIADPAVNACVVELARSLRFTRPDPTGVVDVQLPLALRPHSVPAPDPVCPRTVP